MVLTAERAETEVLQPNIYLIISWTFKFFFIITYKILNYLFKNSETLDFPI